MGGAGFVGSTESTVLDVAGSVGGDAEWVVRWMSVQVGWMCKFGSPRI